MTASIAQLSLHADDLQLRGHVPECGRADGEWRTCQWCLWAIDIPEIRALQDLIGDAETLLGVSETAEVPWIVAVAQLQRTADSTDLSAIRVRSVERLARRLAQHLRSHLTRLATLATRATAPAGPAERRCIDSSGILAALALQSPGHADTVAALPARIRSTLEELNSTLSPETQLNALGRAIEGDHRCNIAGLRTQPEWQALRTSNTARLNRSDPPGAVGPPAGSLEALVVESVVDEVLERLCIVGRDLEGLRPPVTVFRRIEGTELSSATRALVWRTARIDWNLTFCDTGRARCWNTRTTDGAVVAEIPWTVALAIDARRRLGHVSAICGE